MMIITILIILILVVLMYNYYVHHGRNGRLINLIPGIPGYPIFGNITQYMFPREEYWKFYVILCDEYYPIFKVWQLFTPLVFIRHPDDLKIILSNTKHIDKSRHYHVYHPWIGTGLFTNRGTKWHSQRKLLSPIFHSNILQQFVEIFIEESENMTESLKDTGGIVVKDLISFVSEHTLNAICEIVMGTSLRDLGEFQQRYRKAFHHINNLLNYRLRYFPYLYNNTIFSLTPKGKEQTKTLKILHGFTERMIAERKLYHEHTNGRYLESFDNDIPTETHIAERSTIETQRNRLALLDFLIAASRENLLTDLDIREEVDTFMYTGHHTTMLGISFLLALLAEHKDIQDRVRNEIDIAMQKKGEKFTIKLLQDLPYLDRCIKESLRLYPSLPIISRVSTEDIQLQSYLIPAGTILNYNIYTVHRDPNFWPNPEIYDPDRFLPEKIQNRHPYSYIPFNTGPRNCIGQQFALLEMKVMIASLLRNFYLEPVDYLKNLRIEYDFILRPVHPLRIRFVPVCKMHANN